MDLTQEIWNAINSTLKFPEESKKALHIRVMRLIEESKKPTGKRLGVTIMTQEGSLAGDKVAQNRNLEQAPTDAKPKSL